MDWILLLYGGISDGKFDLNAASPPPGENHLKHAPSVAPFAFVIFGYNV